ncbi:hypothetical protein SAMN05443287_102613 [Micromonospora phaseoli]|uniref:Uncharacterized protein n=1 Tax=Micromonospora phaseoli TaxID=1144548 RepID=A0A1H6VAR3_9ACTN|nr:hypothetical protein [Micromonospora phaseoli]PZV93634.1 hypothetical protein CLV64_10993 [Micromonospora phaseoli]GIJ79812.1 hypothetical protein Xph01_42440 [Micromonospora phaseoli]SEJ01673.1 hypothetical protein SAMN05443287_102613 [Micromonospora phaseoli]
MNGLGAAMLALFSPFVAITIAVWGFRRANRADRVRAFFDLYQRYISPEQRRGRRLLHAQLSGRSTEELAALNQEVRDQVGVTLATLNAIAIACEGGYVDVAMVEKSMGRSYSSTVMAAKPYLDHVEGQRGYRPYPYAERLAQRLVERGVAVPE